MFDLRVIAETAAQFGVDQLPHPGHGLVAALGREFAQRGVSFQRYIEAPQSPYGVTVTAPEVVGRWLQSRPNLILRAYMEQAWGIQDVVILYKKAGYFEPLPARAFP